MMNLVRHENGHRADPFQDLAEIRDSLDKFWDSNWLIGPLTRRESALTRSGVRPVVEILNKKDSVVVKAEIPGVEKKDIQVSFEDNRMVLKGEFKKEEEGKEEGYTYSERSYGQFYRSFVLPEDVDTQAAKARYADGILTVTLPKTKESKDRTRQVQIE